MKENNQIKSAIIIGSKGFIGSHLSSYLKKKGYMVYGADVVVDYTSDHYFQIEASNSDFHEIFRKKNFDICVNCSGAASVPDSIEHPLRDFYLNAVNVYKILEAIRQYSPQCKFINLSSAAVYGNPDILPINENLPNAPMSPYGYHKQFSEQICEEFARFFNIQTCSLRIFSAYGEGLKKQLFWDLYQKTKSNKEIVLWGTGNESRDFIYIKDLVRVIELVVEKTEFKGQTINVANGDEVYIKDVVKIFYGLFDKKINYHFSGEGRKGDPNNWVADISELKSSGYQPEFDITKGLKNYYQWVNKMADENK